MHTTLSSYRAKQPEKHINKLKNKQKYSLNEIQDSDKA